MINFQLDHKTVPNACNTTLVAVCVCIMKNEDKTTYGETSSNTKGKIMLIIVWVSLMI